MTTTAAAAGTRRHTGTYPAEPGQVRIARAALAGWLEGWRRVDEAVLVVSEFATNAIMHSASADGGAFTLWTEVGRDRLRIEVEDAGGPWRGGVRDDGRPHGFDVVISHGHLGRAQQLDGHIGQLFPDVFTALAPYVECFGDLP